MGYLVAVGAIGTSTGVRALTSAELARIAAISDGASPVGGALVLEVGGRPTREVGNAVLRGAQRVLGSDVWIGLADGDTVDQGLAVAREAIEIATRVWKDPRVVVSEDTAAFAALKADPARCRRLAAVANPLEEGGQRRQLLRTVEIYLESGSVARAARTLRVHRHTVDERLRAAEKLLGRSLKRSPDRFIVESALFARKLIA